MFSSEMVLAVIACSEHNSDVQSMEFMAHNLHEYFTTSNSVMVIAGIAQYFGYAAKIVGKQMAAGPDHISRHSSLNRHVNIDIWRSYVDVSLPRLVPSEIGALILITDTINTPIIRETRTLNGRGPVMQLDANCAWAEASGSQYLVSPNGVINCEIT